MKQKYVDFAKQLQVLEYWSAHSVGRCTSTRPLSRNERGLRLRLSIANPSPAAAKAARQDGREGVPSGVARRCSRQYRRALSTDSASPLDTHQRCAASQRWVTAGRRGPLAKQRRLHCTALHCTALHCAALRCRTRG
jgi:hypothetical protein